MKLMVEDLEVLFPYDYIYPEQFDYMVRPRARAPSHHWFDL